MFGGPVEEVLAGATLPFRVTLSRAQALALGINFPIALPQITIAASYPGASAKAIEDSVTQIIEQNMKGLDGLMYMNSTSDSAGIATITVTFKAGTSVDMAQVNNPTPMQDADKEDAMLVSITKDGNVFFGSDKITVDALTTKVKDRLSSNAQNKQVYVKADMRARFGSVVAVVDAVRAAGVDDLGLLTEQRKTTPNGPPTTPPTGQ